MAIHPSLALAVLAPLVVWGASVLTGCGGGGAAGEAPDSGDTGAPGVAGAPAMPARYLGANMPFLSDWEYTPVYTDLVKHARRFGHPDHPWGGANDTVPLGADGWPVGDFGLYLMSGPGRLGTYKVAFTGQADVSLTGSPATTLSGKVYDAAKNLTTLDVVRGPGADQMVLVFRNTGGGLKNLRVMRPGYPLTTTALFTREFLDHIARFKTLRFMDWLRTNNNRQVTTWASRTSPDTVHHLSPTGVPWEHLIALGNQTGQDLWINIPLLADDDYVLQLARLFKSTLTSDSKVYVEYSNEVWNASFTQSGDNRDLAAAEVAANPASPLAFDGSTNADLLGFRRTARRLKEIGDLFRSVHGEAAMMTTIRPVLAGQVVQPYIAQMGLEFIEAVYGPPSRYFYALAGAPYVNLGAKQKVDGLGSDEVLAALDESVTAMARVNAFEKNIALARWYGLPLLAYEGGPDTFGPGSIAAKKAAGLDARMLDLCRRYLSLWYAAGGETMMWYMAGATNWDTQYGTWGLSNDFTNTGAPKIQCMDQALASPLPTLQGRHRVPGTVSALAWAGSEEPFGSVARDAVRYMHPGSYVNYVVVAPADGPYTLTLVTEASAVGNKLDVSVNGQVAASMFELVKTGWGNPTDNAPITVTLNQGHNTVRVKTRVETSGFELKSLVFR